MFPSQTMGLLTKQRRRAYLQHRPIIVVPIRQYPLCSVPNPIQKALVALGSQPARKMRRMQIRPGRIPSSMSELISHAGNHITYTQMEAVAVSPANASKCPQRCKAAVIQPAIQLDA